MVQITRVMLDCKPFDIMQLQTKNKLLNLLSKYSSARFGQTDIIRQRIYTHSFVMVVVSTTAIQT